MWVAVNMVGREDNDKGHPGGFRAYPSTTKRVSGSAIIDS